MNEKNTTKTKAITTRHASWFVENGYADPGDLIDHDADLDETAAFFGLFAAYNQHNIAQGTPWDTWPDWELCLTSMPHELQFVEDASEEALVKMGHWLETVQFIHESPHVSVDGYTLSVQGNHGTTFSFDLSLDLRCWTRPGDMAKHMQMLKEGTRPREWMRLHGGNGGVVYAGMHAVGHSLGSFWYVPDHVPYLGGRATNHTADEEFDLYPEHDSLGLAMLTLIHLCIEDTAIWLIPAEQDIYEHIRVAWWEENWPQGRPEDFLCQYTKEEWADIRNGWSEEATRRIEELRRNHNE